MPTIEVEGQSFELSSEVCETDEQLRQALLPYFPLVAVASIERDGDTIKISKRAGTKGYNPFDILKQAPEALNPALALTWQLKELERSTNLPLAYLIELQAKIEEAIAQGEALAEITSHQLNQLQAAAAMTSSNPIIGF